MKKELKADGLVIKIYENRSEMGKAAASAAVAAMKTLLEKKEEINVIFAAAPSQNEILEGIAAADLEFHRIRAFHMDEYIGLPMDAPQRFSSYLDDHIFNKAGFKEVCYLGQSTDIEEECQRYEKLLREYPTDITLMGIGENGHIAFNDPHEARFDDPRLVKPVSLDEACRQQQVNDGCFAELSMVPKTAVTLTIPALMCAETVICTVPGNTKRNALTETVRGEISEGCPASVMRTKNNSTLFCDCDSGRELL